MTMPDDPTTTARQQHQHRFRGCTGCGFDPDDLIDALRSEVEALKVGHEEYRAQIGRQIERHVLECNAQIAALIRERDEFAATLPCGHSSSLLIQSVESAYAVCQLCETVSRLRDALVAERHHTERADRIAAAAREYRDHVDSEVCHDVSDPACVAAEKKLTDVLEEK